MSQIPEQMAETIVPGLHSPAPAEDHYSESSDDEEIVPPWKRAKHDKMILSDAEDSDGEETPQNMGPQNENAAKLAKDGYVVINALEKSPNDMEILKQKLRTAIRRMQEFRKGGPPQRVLRRMQKNRKGATRHVMGAFGGLGVPSSFHHRLIRWIRKRCYEKAKELFADTNQHLEMLIDRTMERIGNIPKEGAHRDCAQNALPGDTIYGGYVNTDVKPQMMRLVPGTQSSTNNGTGFAKLTKEESKAYDEKMVTVMVPPGHMIIFHANIVHCVAPQKVKEPIYRVFIGWRLTDSTEPLMGWRRHKEVFNDQGVPPLPSGQEAPMYARLHWSNWVFNLQTFALDLNPICTTQREVMTGKNVGKTFTIPRSPMPSLKALGLQLYPEYTTQELSMYIPNRIN